MPRTYPGKGFLLEIVAQKKSETPLFTPKLDGNDVLSVPFKVNGSNMPSP